MAWLWQRWVRGWLCSGAGHGRCVGGARSASWHRAPCPPPHLDGRYLVSPQMSLTAYNRLTPWICPAHQSTRIISCLPSSQTPSSLIISRKARRLTVRGAQRNHQGTKAGARQTLCCSPSLQHGRHPTSPQRCRAPPLPRVPGGQICPGRRAGQAAQAMCAAIAPLRCKMPVVHTGSAIATAAHTARTACAAAGWASFQQPFIDERLN